MLLPVLYARPLAASITPFHRILAGPQWRLQGRVWRSEAERRRRRRSAGLGRHREWFCQECLGGELFGGIDPQPEPRAKSEEYSHGNERQIVVSGVADQVTE